MATAPDTTSKLLDELTGEYVSKTELKKRQKQRQRDEEKAKKAAAAPPKPIAVKKSSAEAEEKDLNPNVFISFMPCFQSLIADFHAAILRDSLPQY